MSRFGAKAAPWKKAAGRDEEDAGGDELQATYVPGATDEPPAPAHPPVTCYVLERDGGGWRPSIYRVPASVLVATGELIHTHEPDLKGLAIEQLMRHIEERRS